MGDDKYSESAKFSYELLTDLLGENCTTLAECEYAHNMLYNKSLIEAMQYRSPNTFNHKTIMKLMYASYNKSTARAFSLSIGDKVTFKFTTETKFTDLVSNAIVLYVTRRSNDRRLSRLYEYLTNRLGINFRVTKFKNYSDQNTKIITLPRVASCFPHIVVDCYKNGLGKPLYSSDQMGFDLGSSAAGYFLSTYIASCIPFQVYNDNINVRYLVLLAFILSDNARNKDGKNTDISGIFSFMKSLIETNPLSEDNKNNFMKARDMMNEEGIIHKDILTAADGAKTRIQLARPNKPYWDAFVKNVEALNFTVVDD